MFCESSPNIQTSLSSFYNYLPEGKRKKLDESPEADFYKIVVARIDETPFAAVYCSDNGAPNKPIRTLVGAMILMHGKDWSSREMISNINFDLRTMRALGIDRLDQTPFCRATFFNFQDRIAQHYVQTGENLLEQVFDQVTSEQMEELGIRGDIQRCDSFQAISNIVSYTRVQLLVEMLIRLHRILSDKDKEKFGDLLEPYVKDDSDRYVWELKQSQLPSELEKLGEIYLQLHDKLQEDYGDTEIFRIFDRVFNEQFTVPDQQGRIEVRAPEDIDTDSLQSPDDVDATYREKNGESYRGQAVNVTETANPDNSCQLLTDVSTEPNNTDDSTILNNRLDKMEEKTPELNELHTDGAFGSEENDNKMEDSEIRHVVTGIRGRRSAVNIQIEQQEDTYRVSCPKQTVTASFARKRWKASFDPQVCCNCPHGESCPTRELKSGRTFYFDHSDYLARKRWGNLQKIPPERRKLRPNVEATIKEFTRPLNHKGKLKYRGRFRTALYAFSMALWINFGRENRHRRSENREKEKLTPNRTTQTRRSATYGHWDAILPLISCFLVPYLIVIQTLARRKNRLRSPLKPITRSGSPAF